MTNEPSDHLPDAIPARLAAAGVTNDASLQAALAADPALRQDYEAALAVFLDQALADLAACADGEALLAFWQRVPSVYEEPFLARVEAEVAQAEQAGDAARAEGLRAHLDVLHQIWQLQHDPLAMLLAVLIEVANGEQLVSFWQQVPAELEEPFLAHVAQAIVQAEQNGQDALAVGLRQRLEGMQGSNVAGILDATSTSRC